MRLSKILTGYPRKAGRVSLLYLILAGVWIYITDTLVAYTVTDPDALTAFQTYKGALFVLVTAWLVYILFGRAEREVQEAERFSQAALDGLSQNSICVLDREGTVVAINQAWQAFVEANDGILEMVDIGVNYLAVCDAAAARSVPGACDFAAGLRSVLSGERETFFMEYSRRSSTEQRWFVAGVNRFHHQGSWWAVVSHQNITPLKKAEASLQVSERHLRNLVAILDTTTDFVSTATPEGNLLYMNSAARTILGIEADTDITRWDISVFHPPWANELIQRIGIPAAIRDGTWSGETALVDHTGREVPLSQVILSHKTPDGDLEYLSTIARDISERKQAEEEIRSHARQQTAVAELGIQALSGQNLPRMLETAAAAVARTLAVEYSGIVEALPDGTLWLQAGYGWKPEAIDCMLGDDGSQAGYTLLTQQAVVVEDLTSETRFTPEALLKEHGVVSGLSTLILGRDRPYGVLYAHSTRRRLFTHNELMFLESVAHMLAAAIQRIRAESQINYMAQHDGLTGLPNRLLLQDHLKLALARARHDHQQVALLSLDLDRFKKINDMLGHSAGDAFLKAVTDQLQHRLRESDTLARLGSDEFMIVLPDVTVPQNAASVAQKLLDELSRPVLLHDQPLFCSASIGISLYPVDAAEADEMIRNANAAMYRAKEFGGNNYQFFTEDLNARIRERLLLENGLRQGLQRQEFTLCYQPKLDAGSRHIIGVEALLRWQHPLSGAILPARFIPVAEETGTIIPLGEWVLRQACQQIRTWAQMGCAVPVAVNLSVRQLHHPGIADIIARILAETNVAAEYLEIEITETDLMKDPEQAAVTLEQLKASGLKIAIDDFGMGYSSLSRLKRLPVHVLKIDRSFVRDLETDPDDATIVKTIIVLAHSLGLQVVAEGVETEQQLAFLQVQGCEMVQGFLFSRPVPAEELTRLLDGG